MNLYHISQDVNRGYDTYSDAVVAAEGEDDAKNIHPSNTGYYGVGLWALPKDVKVRLIGTAAPGVEFRVICASFHAG